MKVLFLALMMAFSLTSYSQAHHKVIAGVSSSNKEYPWQVSLQTRFGSHYCGGVLISVNKILTAAHCVEGTSLKNIRPKGGSSDGSLDGLRSLGRVDDVFIHPDYKSKKVIAHDIAVIKLKREVRVSDVVKTVALPRKQNFPFNLQQDFIGLNGKLVITGWGKTNTGGRLPVPSDQLMEGELSPLGSSTVDLSKAELREYLLKTYELEDSTVDYLQSLGAQTLILEGKSNGESPCDGDSGGPITYFSKSGPVLVGISSYVAGGDGPCQAIAGATDVQSYLDWIDSL